MHLEAGIPRRIGKGGDHRLDGRVRGAQGPGRQAGIDDIGAGFDGFQHAHRAHAGGVVGVELHRDLERFFERLDQVVGIGRRNEPGHILDAEGIGAHSLELFGFFDVIVEVVDRAAHGPFGQRVADGQLGVLALGLDGLQNGLEVALVVDGVENAEDIHAAVRGMFHKSGRHIVGVIAVTDQVLAAEEHLQRRLGRPFFHLAQAVPRVFVQETDGHVERGAAPDLQRVEAGLVHVADDIQDVIGSHAGGKKRLVAVAKGQVGDFQWLSRHFLPL